MQSIVCHVQRVREQVVSESILNIIQECSIFYQKEYAHKDMLSLSHNLTNSASALMTNVSVTEEASKFLRPGYFHGELEDTMLTALSNVLQVSIIVFSSIACHPVFCVEPRRQALDQPLVVAYNQSGSGHYDGVIPMSKCKHDDSDSQTETYVCSCGKSSKSASNSCCQIRTKYSTSV